MSKIFTDTVPTDMEAKVKEAYLAIWPNTNMIADPDWVDPEDGSQAPQIPEYPNDWVWIQYKIRRNNRQIYHTVCR